MALNLIYTWGSREAENEAATSSLSPGNDNNVTASRFICKECKTKDKITSLRDGSMINVALITVCSGKRLK